MPLAWLMLDVGEFPQLSRGITKACLTRVVDGGPFDGVHSRSINDLVPLRRRPRPASRACSQPC